MFIPDERLLPESLINSLQYLCVHFCADARMHLEAQLSCMLGSVNVGTVDSAWWFKHKVLEEIEFVLWNKLIGNVLARDRLRECENKHLCFNLLFYYFAYYLC